MGLLDDFSEFIKTPGGQGLLSAAFGGMAGAQKGAPLNSLGRAGMAGMMGYGGALDRQQQTAEAAQMGKYRDMQQSQMQMQMDAAKKKQEQEEAQAAWRGGLPAAMNAKVYGAGDEGPTMAQDTNALNNYLLHPDSPYADDVMKSQLFPKAADYKEVGGTLLKVGANGVTPVYTAPAKPEGKPTKVQEYEYAKANGYKGTLEQYVSIGPALMAAAQAPLRSAQVDNINQENAYNLPPPRTAPASKPSAPMKGQVVQGYRFKGGNPADQSNWEKQ